MPGDPRVALPNNQHTVFYAHSIHINGVEIGSFERLSMRSTRSAERIREVLYSRGAETKEIVWGGTDISVDLSRVELYSASILQAFGFTLYSIEELNQPVNITEIRINPDDGSARTITYTDCVATSWGKDLDTGTARVVESMTFEVRTIRGSVQ